MGPQCPVGMGISLGVDFAPELLNVVTSLIPTLHHIGLVGIKTTAMRMVVVRFHIRTRRKPALDRSPSETDPASDLFDLHPLLTQCHDLLVALIPLSLVRRVRHSISGHQRARRFFCCWWIDRLGALWLSLQFCSTNCYCFLYCFCQ